VPKTKASLCITTNVPSVDAEVLYNDPPNATKVTTCSTCVIV